MTSVARSRTPAPSADKQIRSNDEVSDAIATGRPVVVMESTIYSSLGLPSPHNLEAYDRCTAAIRAAGAVPALSAVLGGECWVGTPDDELERILSITNKVSTRDLYVAVARGADGVTTVAASVTLAALAGVDVFATGGMGGVHRGSEISGDVSADLGALGREPVVTVTAGAKAFLDLPKTVEYLDTLVNPSGTSSWLTNALASAPTGRPSRARTPSGVRSSCMPCCDPPVWISAGRVCSPDASRQCSPRLPGSSFQAVSMG